MQIGFPELVVIGLIALLVFGPGRIVKLGGELGGAIQSLREGLKEDQNPANSDEKDDQ